jgi:hypothetical protein
LPGKTPRLGGSPTFSYRRQRRQVQPENAGGRMGFAREMAGRMPAGMALPEEFSALFEEMLARNWTMASERHPGDRLGLLGSEAELHDGAVTAVLFRVATRSEAREFGRDWFDDVVPEIETRGSCPSHGPARTGPLRPSGSTMPASRGSCISGPRA